MIFKLPSYFYIFQKVRLKNKGDGTIRMQTIQVPPDGMQTMNDIAE